MAPSTITTSLAEESDAPTLASIMTAAFAASDAAYSLIWGPAPAGTHENLCISGIFSPVQKEGRITFKAVDSSSGQIVGFASWMMPRRKIPIVVGSGLPPLEGVNIDLWNLKNDGLRKSAARDEDPEKDMRLAFFFVLPEFQRRGIGSMLLGWGKTKADELGAKIWLSATPKATPLYEENGWKVVERYELDLTEHGGEGLYVRAWMLREPA